MKFPLPGWSRHGLWGEDVEKLRGRIISGDGSVMGDVFMIWGDRPPNYYLDFSPSLFDAMKRFANTEKTAEVTGYHLPQPYKFYVESIEEVKPCDLF